MISNARGQEQPYKIMNEIKITNMGEIWLKIVRTYFVDVQFWFSFWWDIDAHNTITIFHGRNCQTSLFDRRKTFNVTTDLLLLGGGGRW